MFLGGLDIGMPQEFTDLLNGYTSHASQLGMSVPEIMWPQLGFLIIAPRF